jgi:AcrR family transcriptional regulator
MTEAGRVYGGRSETERRADRRSRLLAAGLDLFGTEGWSTTTIEKLCTSAGVATRSFYEEFPSREALLLAVFEDVLSGVVDEVTPKVVGQRTTEDQVRAGLGGYVQYLTADPRRARVVHHEVRVAGSLERQRHAMTVRFAELITKTARLGGSPRSRILGVALAGAVSEALVDWVERTEPRPDTGPLVEVLVDLFLAATQGREALVSSPAARAR